MIGSRMSTSPARPVITFSRLLLELHGGKKMILLSRFAGCEGYCRPGIAGGQLGHPVERASRKGKLRKWKTEPTAEEGKSS